MTIRVQSSLCLFVKRIVIAYIFESYVVFHLQILLSCILDEFLQHSHLLIQVMYGSFSFGSPEGWERQTLGFEEAQDLLQTTHDAAEVSCTLRFLSKPSR